MQRYPSMSEANGFAKKVSKSTNIKLNHAKQIMAFRFGCQDWSELVGLAGTIPPDLGEFSNFYAFEGLVNRDDVELLKRLTSPHIEAFAEMLRDDVHTKDCILRKIVEGRFSQISGDVLLWVVHPEQGSIDWGDAECVAKHIKSYDDTATRAVSYRRMHGEHPVNLWVNNWLYGLRIYGYYTFKGKKVDVVIRELDLEITRPSTHNTIGSSVASCKWFAPYLLGCLRVFFGELKALGYSGTVRICKVNGVRAEYLHYNTRPNGGIEAHEFESLVLVRELLALGGEWGWDELEGNRKAYLGVKLPFGNVGDLL